MRTCGAFEGMLIHWQIARRLWPRDYRDRIAFGPCWFVRVESDAAFPRFEATQVVRAAAGRHFGPLPTRKDAELLVRWLEDAFDLCRYYDVLLKTPDGERCVYYEMGRCPAPCDGTVPMEIYHSSVGEALAFIRRPDDAALSPVRQRMQTAVDALAYERAGAYKKVIDEASRWTDRPMHRRVCDIRTTDWLIIVRAEPRRRGIEKTHIKAFILSDGEFKSLAAGRSAELAGLLPQWRKDAREFAAESRSSASNDVLVTESLRLVSHFLFRKEQRDALIYPLDALPEDAHIERSLFLIVETATKRG